MGKNVIIGGVWLFLLMVLFFFTESPMPLFLLIASVLVPAASLALSALWGRALEVRLSLGEISEKDQCLTGEALLSNRGNFPFPSVALELCCKNLLTGESIDEVVGFSVPPRSEAAFALAFTVSHCGKILVTATKIRIYDFFGLLPMKRECNIKSEALILPTMFSPEIIVGKSSTPDLDCDTFSPYKAGNDPSETFAIRDYKPGDSLGSIHWKLTGKFDKMMIREASLPMDESVLILFERVEQRGYASPAAEISAALGEIVVSLSHSLIDQGCSHCVGWLNPENTHFSEYRIDTEESFSLILPQILAAAPVRYDGNTVDFYLKSFDSCPYANIIYVSPYPAGNLTLLNPLSRLTMILCTAAETEFEAENGVGVYTVTPENYEHALYQILV